MIYPDYINKIILDLCKQSIDMQSEGYGPFVAAICDKNGEILVTAHNSVVRDNCSLCHAEINAIKEIQKILKTYDLSPFDLSICITAEPCAMCVGAIMWSGIKNIYYGVPSKEVEKITGFDEGYKPDWQDYLSKKGIKIYGNIEPEACRNVLTNYMNSKGIIYKPS